MPQGDSTKEYSLTIIHYVIARYEAISKLYRLAMHRRAPYVEIASYLTAMTLGFTIRKNKKPHPSDKLTVPQQNKDLHTTG
jgi:hypothetical protein